MDHATTCSVKGVVVQRSGVTDEGHQFFSSNEAEQFVTSDHGESVILPSFHQGRFARESSPTQ